MMCVRKLVVVVVVIHGVINLTRVSRHSFCFCTRYNNNTYELCNTEPPHEYSY